MGMQTRRSIAREQAPITEAQERQIRKLRNLLGLNSKAPVPELATDADAEISALRRGKYGLYQPKRVRRPSSLDGLEESMRQRLGDDLARKSGADRPR